MGKTLPTADSCSSFLRLTHYWYVINAIQCVAVFSPLLHLWVLCSPSHCCIHFWILKSRSQYTPKADTLTSAPLFCFYLVIFYLFLFWFEVFGGFFCLFFLLSSPALPPYLWKKCQHWGLSASSPWMNGDDSFRPTVPPTCLTFWFGFKCLSTNSIFLSSWIAPYTTPIQKAEHCKAKKGTQSSVNIVNPYFIHNWT